MRTRTLIVAVSLTGAITLAAGIAVGVSIPDAPQARTAHMPVAEPRYVAPPVNLDQIIETCAWQQASFYGHLRIDENYGIDAENNHRAESYAWGKANCERSVAEYGVDQLIEKYRVGE